MKKTLPAFIALGFFLVSLISTAQTHKCATMQILQQRIAKDPSALTRRAQSEAATQKWIATNYQAKRRQQIVTIPVVVHVLYHAAVENISTAQIQSQIDILNEDFRLMNADALTSSHPFYQYAADVEVEFCLASRDPNGNATTGITRTYTDSIEFAGYGALQYTAAGGINNWDPTSYLNIWVCHLSANGPLGFAYPPSDLSSNPDEDGVVIRYEAFGNIGTAGTGTFTTNNLGRTATHEVGHWLNLSHIWGDNQPNCGDDLVSDTEPADEPNYGAPTFPHDAFSTCGTGANGEMYMDYMDYSDDAEMAMFTIGQAQRMQAALNGDRAGILTSLGCSSPSGIHDVLSQNSFDIYPNPTNGVFSIDLKFYNPKQTTSLSILNVLGETVKNIPVISNNSIRIDASELTNGVYYLQVKMVNRTETKKIFITK